MRHLVICIPLLVLGLGASGDPFRSSARAEEAPAPAHELRLATLAPRQSQLGNAFQELRKQLRERTGGQVELKMYHGGVAGDEMTVVRKMRVGQLDGALLTATGLGALVPQVMVLQAPGVIGSYAELDDVRQKLAPELEALFDKAGYALISWGDSGQTRIFSKYKIQHPNDLKQTRPWVWRGSPTMKAFIEAAGANGVLLGLPEVFSALQTGMIDTLIASSVGVLGFQWHTRLNTMTKPATGVVVGAYVIKKDRLEALPKEARDYILQSAKEHAAEFRDGGRKFDAEAAEALARRLETVNIWRNKDAWREVQRKARESLVGRLYSRSLLTRVQEILGKAY
jgi:TRAP-type C4-dicarboxylate transport system substrate-binding protein